MHDLRRTGSTLLNELGFNRDWIEKCLAHEEGRSSRGVYNKAEYEQQRRHMLQEWADMIDAWVEGRRRSPTLYPPSLELVADIRSQPVDDHGRYTDASEAGVDQEGTGRVLRKRTSGDGARLKDTAPDARRRSSIQASTSDRPHTTQRAVRLNRRGNSPRCSSS